MSAALDQRPAALCLLDHQIAVTAFLAREARLLDEHRFEDWLALLDESISYRVPVRSVTRDGCSEYQSGDRVNDGIKHIRARISRLQTGWAWAEEPASRVVRCLGGVDLEAAETADRIVAHSAVIAHRHRAQTPDPDVFAYRRCDELVIDGGGYRLAARTIFTAANVLLSPNLSIFL